MRVFRIIEDLGVDPEIKEAVDPGNLQEDVEKNENSRESKKERTEGNTGD